MTQILLVETLNSSLEALTFQLFNVGELETIKYAFALMLFLITTHWEIYDFDCVYDSICDTQ